MLRRVVLVRTDVSEELSTSFIRLTRICELATTLDVSSNRRTLRSRKVPPKRLFLQEPLGVTSQKTPFFIVTAVKTSNLTLTSPFSAHRIILIMYSDRAIHQLILSCAQSVKQHQMWKSILYNKFTIIAAPWLPSTSVPLQF
jgi:hypothetical protein